MIGATIETEFDAEERPRVRVRIHLNPADRRKRQRRRLPIPVPVEVWALLDTGAEYTCVSPDVASNLALPLDQIRLVNVPGIAGLTGTLIRDASLTILHHEDDSQRNLVIPDTAVTELDLVALGYDALIGRDVLAMCRFTYDGLLGSFTLDY